MSAQNYFGTCPHCGELLGFGHIPDTCKAETAYRKLPTLTGKLDQAGRRRASNLEDDDRRVLCYALAEREQQLLEALSKAATSRADALEEAIRELDGGWPHAAMLIRALAAKKTV